jgi:hypothetical protein
LQSEKKTWNSRAALERLGLLICPPRLSKNRHFRELM